MTDAEISALVVKLNEVVAYLKSKNVPGRMATVQEGVVALQGLVTERTAFAAEKTAWLAEREALLLAASGQLYHDIAYGVKNAWKDVGELPAVIALQKATDALPPEA